MLISRGNGNKLAWTSAASVAVVLMAPVIASAACLCVLASFAVGPHFRCWGLPSFAVLALQFGRKMSTAYRKLGMVALMYSLHARCAGMPLVPWHILFRAIDHLAPLAMACTACSLNCSSLSIATPRYLVVRCSWMMQPSNVSDVPCNFPLSLDCLSLHLVKPISAVLSISNIEWCDLAKCRALPSIVIMSGSMLFASSNVWPWLRTQYHHERTV